MSNTNVRIERVYDDPEGATGGFRVFVDRLWPRGESKAKFHYDVWAKDVTPSTALREWYHADRPGRWEEFMKKYNCVLNLPVPLWKRVLRRFMRIIKY